MTDSAPKPANEDAECGPELAELNKQLKSKDFYVAELADASIGPRGQIVPPFLTLKGKDEDAERLTDMIIMFYEDETDAFDAKLMVVGDPDDSEEASPDDEIEFELTFEGADTLARLPPEILSTEKKESIMRRYTAEMGAFAAFLSGQKPL